MTKKLLAFLAIFTAGCAQSVPDGFDDVRGHVADRMDMPIQWSGHSAAPGAIDASVRSVLAHPLSVDDAVRITLLNNANLQAAYEDLGIARADVIQAGLIRNPVLNVIARFPDKPPSGMDIEVAVEEDLVSLLTMARRKKIAQAQFTQSQIATADAVVDLAAQTRTAFYEYQGALQMLELRRTVLQSVSAAAQTAQALHDAGNLSELDVAAQQSLEAETRLEISSTEADVADRREKLNVLMGLSGSDINWSSDLRLPDLPTREVDPKNLESVAIGQRLDLASAKAQVTVAAQSLGLAKSLRFFPEGSVGIDSERTPDGQTVTGPTLAIPIPLFDTGQAQVLRGKSLLAQAMQRYNARVVESRAQVRAAYARMMSARQRIDIYRTTMLPLQRRIVDQSQRYYNGMLLGIFQLLQARQNQINSGRNYIESLQTYWVARAQLERATGGKLPLMPEEKPATRPTTNPGETP